MMTDSVTAAINKAKLRACLLKTFGWSITILNSTTALTGLTQISRIFEIFDMRSGTTLALLTAIGVFMIIMGNRITKLVKLFPEYSARLAADPEKSITRVASYTGVAVEVATEYVRNMLALGFFPSYCLDAQHNRLVMSQSTVNKTGTSFTAKVGSVTTDPAKVHEQMEQILKSMNQFASVNTDSASATTSQPPRTIICPNCGAMTKIVSGTANKCDYCDSPIASDEPTANPAPGAPVQQQEESKGCLFGGFKTFVTVGLVLFFTMFLVMIGIVVVLCLKLMFSALASS